MKERMKRDTAALSDSEVQHVLTRIKEAQLTNHDDYMEALRLIERLRESVDPSVKAMLQIEAALKLYNATKSPDTPETTIADALLLALKNKAGHLNGSTKEIREAEARESYDREK